MRIKRNILRHFLFLMAIVSVLFLLSVHGNAAVYDDHNILTLEKAGESICTFYGQHYKKENDGWSLAGYYRSEREGWIPLLVGKTEESVTIRQGDRVYNINGRLEFEGETYYFSCAYSGVAHEPLFEDGHPLYLCLEGEMTYAVTAAQDLLERSKLICNQQFREHQAVCEVVLEQPTCTTEGVWVRFCETCGDELERKTLAPQHAYGEYVVDLPAACAYEGKQHAVCTLCAYVDHATIPALPHTYGEGFVLSGSKFIPPIVTAYRCSVCNHTETVADYGYVWVPIVAAVGIVAVVIGMIGYAKAFKKKP